MLSFKIFCGGIPAGTARAERDGLYWRLRAECGALLPGPARLYAEDGGKRICLGVPAPVPGEKTLLLERRLSCRSVPLTEASVLTLEAPALRLRYCPGEPFPLIAYFRAFRLEKADGEYWWTARQGAGGLPAED